MARAAIGRSFWQGGRSLHPALNFTSHLWGIRAQSKPWAAHQAAPPDRKKGGEKDAKNSQDGVLVFRDGGTGDAGGSALLAGCPAG